ncbi:MAG TPA: hypothetical protein PKY77_15015 [Phycisphaerae bacterium]|nr:hypothetical protein [Phycisphaerae bacterium]HRY70445.1 hypothetical protein [Phycisphaerae bacterium]HSA27679.1 hypothetical protein [Phycisphaerae bacterium]
MISSRRAIFGYDIDLGLVHLSAAPGVHIAVIAWVGYGLTASPPRGLAAICRTPVAAVACMVTIGIRPIRVRDGRTIVRGVKHPARRGQYG